MDMDIGTVVDLEEKALSEDDDHWTFTGYASIFGTKDLGNDVMVQGAFADSLQTHGLPLILLNHKMDDLPVATCIEARENKRGLWIKGEIDKGDVFCSQRLVPQLKRRGLKGMSIGYRVMPGGAEMRKSDGVRLLKRVRLYEASFVSLPMHPDAGLESIKGRAGEMSSDKEELLQLMGEFTRTVKSMTEQAREQVRIEPVRDLADLSRVVAEFVKECKRNRPQLDAFERAEAALREADAVLARIRKAAR